MMPPWLEAKSLTVWHHPQNGQPVRALNGVNLAIFPGEAVALLGASGSGKSSFCLAVTGLLEPSAVVTGEIWIAGRCFSTQSDVAWPEVRGRQVGMVFQDARGALDPAWTVGQQLMETVGQAQGRGPRASRQEALEWLHRVRFAEPQRVLDAYPHQLSGGMCQRVMLALALARRPQLLVADEPTAALDVVGQAQILQLLANLRREMRLSLLLITHDAAVAASVADRMVVLGDGAVLESGRTSDVVTRPQHPFTRQLLRWAEDPGAGWGMVRDE